MSTYTPINVAQGNVCGLLQLLPLQNSGICIW